MTPAGQTRRAAAARGTLVGIAALAVTLGAARTARGQANPLAGRAPNPPAKADAWAGTYVGDGIKVELATAAGGKYAGTITFRGQAMRAVATSAAGKLSGTFEHGGSTFDFTIARRNGGFALTSGGQSYALTKATRAAGRFAGRFVSGAAAGRHVLTLVQKGDALRGTITDPEGRQHAVEAKVAGSAAKGTATGPGGKVLIEMALDGDRLVVVSVPTNPLSGQPQRDAGKRLVYTRAPAGPTAPPTGQSASAAAARPPKGWRRYALQNGFSFHHPPNWKLEASAGSVRLAPADAASTDKGPLEHYVISMEVAKGVTKLSDPNVAAFFDSAVRNLAAPLKRTGAMKSAACGIGPGGVLTYGGRSPTGIDVRADVFVTLTKDSAVFLLAMGKADVIAKRLAVVRRIFATFSMAGAQPAAGGTKPAGGKVAPAVPPAKAASGAAIRVPTTFAKYKHSLGFEMRYPKGWTVRETDDAVNLLPPGAGQGSAESYVISSQENEGVTKVSDPQVTQFFDASMQRLAPHMRRSGAMKLLRCVAGPGGVLSYTGKHPQTGKPVLVDVYVTMMKGRGVYLMAAGEADAIQKRRRVTTQIFSSFGAGKAKIDARLVGRWYHWRGSSSHNTLTGGGTSFSHEKWLAMNADGTCWMSSRSNITADTGTRDAFGQDTPTWRVQGDARGKGDALSGIWSAADGRIVILWSDGGETNARYASSGRQGWVLHLKSGSKVAFMPAKSD